MESAEVDVADMMDDVLKEYKTTKGNGVKIITDISLVQIQCWKRGLYQVFKNLIDNAIKFSRRKEYPEVKIIGEETATSYRFRISDNGVGFDMKYHDRIFQLFHRLKATEDIKGTGAGLAIVKKVVEKQGGNVWAESELGKGTTFFVELPKNQDGLKRD